MSLKALLYAYILGGLTFIPLLILAICFYAVYTAVPIGDSNVDKLRKAKLEQRSQEEQKEEEAAAAHTPMSPSDLNDLPKTRKGWLTVRRTFEETPTEGTYVGFVRGLLDARSKDPKRSKPKDMWYVVLKGKVLYLYEDENMVDCEAAIELGGHDVVVYPEGLLDGELFAKRNAIMLKPRIPPPNGEMPSVTKEMSFTPDCTDPVIEKGGSEGQKRRDRERAKLLEKRHEEARQEALNRSTPWFIFVKSNVEMEDWYLAFIHASDNPPNSSTLTPLQPVFQPADMSHLVSTLDEQPDVIPMRWLNALIGRLFFSYYRTDALESYIIGRLMKKLSKVKRPGFLTSLSVREVSVGNRAPTFSKPMLKELTKEGDASLEVHLQYKGEIRITVDATVTVNLGARFKPYNVKVVLAAVLRELEGNLLIKVKRPPSNRIWYAFTQPPRMVLDVEPVVSDRQITWSMILGTIESKLKEVIQESVVLPNMDDIAFFESIPYKHRGGIWADASRSERAPETFPGDAVSSDEDQLPASAPVSDPSTPLANDINHIPMQRSHSDPSPDMNSSPEINNAASLPRAITVATAASGSSSTKRRTWFGTPREDDAESSSSSKRGTDEVSTSFQSGWSDIGSEPISRQISQRSASSASSREEQPQTPLLREFESEDTEQRTPVPFTPSSSHSEAPTQDVPAPSSKRNSTPGSPAESLLSAFRPKSLASQSPNNSTFLQTLKSRDKQAISGAAKETIRKWGANWGLNKKDNAGSGEESTDGEPSRQTEHRLRPGSSYADLRAAVEQRRASHQDPSLLGPTFHSTKPIDIRQDGRMRDVSPAGSSSSYGNVSHIGTSFGESNSPSSSPRPGEHTERQGQQLQSEPPALPPTLPPRGRMVSHRSQPGVEGLDFRSEDEHPPEPIRTQPPPPKTMMIPGIHASHRGEVMSMGYAPPQPAVEPKGTPALQNMYRLWKSPAQQSQEQVQTANGTSGEVREDGSTQSEASVPVMPPTRPIPPPLPPRSFPTHAVQLTLTSEPPLHPPELDKTSPPATAALQSIVSKDRSKRASLEPVPRLDEAAMPMRSETPASWATPTPSENSGVINVPPKPTPPALPPRRITTMPA